MIDDNIETNFLEERSHDLPRDSFIYDNEINNFMEIHESDKISNDIQLLRDMGYDYRMINKVYILLQPETLERAIDYMTEVDGIYQHDFFENNYKTKDKNICFICHKSRRYHLDYIPQEFIDENDFNFKFKEDINNDINFNKSNHAIKIETFICNVCFDEIDEEEKNYNALKCGHVYCTQCWINYLKTSIEEAKVEKLKCMDIKCKEILPEEFIFKHIETDTKLVEKYKKFRKRAEIINDPNKKQCPKPDCDSFLQKPNRKKKICEM